MDASSQDTADDSEPEEAPAPPEEEEPSDATLSGATMSLEPADLAPPGTESRTRVDLGAFSPIPDLEDVDSSALSPEGTPMVHEDMGYRVVVTVPDRPDQTYPLRDGENVMGRAADCDVVVNHPSLSRRHAVLDVAGAAVKLRDNDSTNGVFIDDEEVKEADLESGATFRLGTDVEVRLEQE